MLEFKNVSYKTEDGFTIIDDVSFACDGGFICITGPNGGGKSTIARLIAGIYKPTSGKIYLDGKDITDLSVTDHAKLGITYAFQQPVKFKGLNVKDLLNLAAGKNLSSKEACQYLSAVGLCAKDYINREANGSLSGGELKRIEIALAMARNTSLSVFDEPEAGIDLWSFNNLIDVFKELRAENNGTIIIISHQERILRIADRIIVVADGTITANDAGEKIFPELVGTGNAKEPCKYYRKRVRR